MKIKAFSQWIARFNIQRNPKNVGVYLEISLLDCLTTKKFQDFSKISTKFQGFPGLFSNFRTFQDWWEPWHRTSKKYSESDFKSSLTIIGFLVNFFMFHHRCNVWCVLNCISHWANGNMLRRINYSFLIKWHSTYIVNSWLFHITSRDQKYYKPTNTCSKSIMEISEHCFYEICSKLAIKTPERRQWRKTGVVIVNFEQISELPWCFHSWL